MVLGDPATSNGQRKARSVALGLQEPAERTLVEAAKGGHSTAFDTLCERYAQQLLRAAHRITRSREDAEDAVQDALLSAFIHLRDFDGRSSFATWLTRIRINSALMRLRKRRSWREIYVDDSIDPHGNQTFWDVPDPSPDPENVSQVNKRTKQCVLNCVFRVFTASRYAMRSAKKLLSVSLAECVKGRRVPALGGLD